MKKSYKQVLKEELAHKNYYDGWTVKGMEEKLNKLENQMTLLEFHSHRAQWLKEWNSKYRLLDIDFETYMLMNTNITKEEFRRLTEKEKF